MDSGVTKTLKFLEETANEAAVAVLVAGLDSQDSALQEGALQAMLGRRRGAGQRELVARWDKLTEHGREMVALHPRRIAAAVRSAILSQELEVCAKGCHVLRDICEYELIPALVTAVEQEDDPFPVVIETLMHLTERLHEEMFGPRERRQLQDPVRMRQFVLPCLQTAVDRFDRHRNRDLVEAFIVLTGHENVVLKRILREPRHPAYLVLTDLLATSPRMPVIRLVLNLLCERHASSAALHLVSKRRDPRFVGQLLNRIGLEPTKTVCKNLRRIESISWLEDDLSALDSLTDAQQGAAVQLAAHSGMNRLRAFAVIRRVFEIAGESGRRAASAALSGFGGADANELAWQGLDDPDPEVQANVASQLRDRGIPGAISRLIQLLDSPHAIVQLAAQESLSEFNFRQYISVFEMMENDVRRSTGVLVMRVDPHAVEQLGEELKSFAHSRRLRALEAAIAMDAVEQVEPLVIGLLSDDDHFIRAEAARTLGHCDTPLSRQALRDALLDRSVAVREAAEQALQDLLETVPVVMNQPQSGRPARGLG